MINSSARLSVLVVLGISLGVTAPTAAVGQADEPEVISLTRAIQIALASSQTLRDAELDLDVAGHQVREAFASVLPDVSATASYARNLKVQQGFLPAFIFDRNAPRDQLIPIRFGSDNTWQAGLTASQPLFQMDAFIGLGAAGRFREFQEERVRGTAQDVVTTVRLAYFNALLAGENVRLTQNSVERVRKTLDETRAMNRAGMASDYDVLRLQVQLGNLEPNLRRARFDLAANKRTLLVEMGIDPELPIELEGRLNEIDLDDVSHNSAENSALLRVSGVGMSNGTSLDEAVQLALEERSDVRQIRSQILLNEAQVQVERADFFPKLSVFSNYNVTAQQDGSPVFFGNRPSQRTTTAVAGLRVEVPIFRGLDRDARVQEARSAVRQNETRLERLRRQAANELHTLLDNLTEAYERSRSQRLAVAQAQRGFEIASAEYRAGVGSQLQITDAEVALRESEFNYAQAVYDYLVARARLDAAAGTVPDRAGMLAVRGDRQESSK
ncbi:MAG: TolC family protein [Gemmatimonadales bacterium]